MWFQDQRGLCCYSGGQLKTQTSLQILLIIILRLPCCALMSPSPWMMNGIRGGQKKMVLKNNKEIKSLTFTRRAAAHFFSVKQQFLLFSLRDTRRREASGRKSAPSHEGHGDQETHQTRSPPRRRRSRSPSRRRSATTSTRTCWWLPRSRISPAGTSACLQTGR